MVGQQSVAAWSACGGSPSFSFIAGTCYNVIGWSAFHASIWGGVGHTHRWQIRSSRSPLCRTRPRQEAIDLARAFVTDMGIRYESVGPVIHHDANSCRTLPTGYGQTTSRKPQASRIVPVARTTKRPSFNSGTSCLAPIGQSSSSSTTELMTWKKSCTSMMIPMSRNSSIRFGMG